MPANDVPLLFACAPICVCALNTKYKQAHIFRSNQYQVNSIVQCWWWLHFASILLDMQFSTHFMCVYVRCTGILVLVGSSVNVTPDIYFELAIHYLRFFPMCDRLKLSFHLPSPLIYSTILYDVTVYCCTRLKYPLLSMLRFTQTYTVLVSVFVVYTTDQ